MLDENLCQSFTYQLSGLPSHPERLKSKMIQLITSGTIQEVEQKETAVHIQVSFTYKSENWLIELILKGQTWSLGDLYYQGERSKGSYTRIARIMAITSFFLLSGLLIIYYCFFIQTGFPTVLSKSYVFSHIPSQSETLKRKLSAHSGLDAIAHGEQSQHAEENTEISPSSDSFADVSPHGEDGNEEIMGHLQEEELFWGDMDEEATAEEISIQIKAGMSGYQVASILEKHDLVRSKEEIREIFSLLGIQGKIQTGTFSIPKDATYAEIIKIITEKKDK